MKKLKQYLIAAVLVASGFMVVAPAVVSATPIDEIQGGVTDTGQSSGPSIGSGITKIVNILLYVLGFIAVIVIVISGIRYATSGGDASAVKGAKDGILYAVIGLIVAILAYAIVNFVLVRFK